MSKLCPYNFSKLKSIGIKKKNLLSNNNFHIYESNKLLMIDNKMILIIG